jgi:hypothetical protein
MKPLTREEVENPPGASYTTIDGLERGRVLALLDERDELRSELAITVNRSDQAASERDALRALVEEQDDALKLAAGDNAALRAQKERLENALTAQRPTPDIEHDARVRIAALADAPFVAAAIEAKRLETIDEVANHVARCMVMIESPDRVKTCAAIIADIRALKETP